MQQETTEATNDMENSVPYDCEKIEHINSINSRHNGQKKKLE